MEILISFLRLAGLFALAMIVFAAGFLTGRSRVANKPPAYKCDGCEHPLSFHAPETGKCHHGVHLSSKWQHCSCQLYVGSKPFPEVDLPVLLRTVEDNAQQSKGSTIDKSGPT